VTPTPEELQLDALREVANVGAGHAAQALSKLTGGTRISMDIPRATRMDAGGLAQLLGGGTAKVVAASFEMDGALQGRLIVVWPKADAERLGQWLVKVFKQEESPDLQQSALTEAANIVASACLSAVGQLAGLRLVPSVPTLSWSSAAEVAGVALGTEGDGRGMVLEARLHSTGLQSHLLLIPDAESTRALLTKLGL
jgi:chemotaxis protein CheC